MFKLVSEDRQRKSTVLQIIRKSVPSGRADAERRTCNKSDVIGVKNLTLMRANTVGRSPLRAPANDNLQANDTPKDDQNHCSQPRVEPKFYEFYNDVATITGFVLCDFNYVGICFSKTNSPFNVIYVVFMCFLSVIQVFLSYVCRKTNALNTVFNYNQIARVTDVDKITYVYATCKNLDPTIVPELKLEHAVTAIRKGITHAIGPIVFAATLCNIKMLSSFL